jgi:polysaccharide export outer membrane protein
MKKLSLIALCMALLSLTGCGGRQEVRSQKPDIQSTQNTKSEKMNDLLLKTAINQNVDPNADYIIGSDDLLEIEVYQAEELKRTTRVSSKGYIGMPLIGQIKAKGLTAAQLEEEIAKRLDKYMEEPVVNVYLKEYKAQRISVIGAVKMPQVYVVTGQKYLLDMLTLAGGIAGDAGTICYILRPVNNGQTGMSKTETLVVDLKDLLEKGNLTLNIPVFSGDVINVPKGGVFFVDGAVEKPGVYQLAGNTTLMEAIIMAGGMKFEAIKSEVQVLKNKGDGTRDLITIDYEAIKNGQREDIFIDLNDLIIVPKNGFKSFLVGIGTIFSGAVNLGGGSLGVR